MFIRYLEDVFFVKLQPTKGIDKPLSYVSVKSKVLNMFFRMISSCKTKEEVTELSKTGQRLFNMVEECQTPVVAAINGSCLGGGLEVSYHNYT